MNVATEQRIANMRPLSDRVLVKRAEKQYSGLILLVTDDKPTLKRGEVVAVGPGKLTESGARIPVDVKVGQIVHWGQFTDHEEGQYELITEGDIRFIEEC